MSNFDRVNLKEMTVRDMENYMRKTVADTLDKPKSFDRRQWVETYDLRTQIKEDVKKRDKERSTTSSHKREEVFVLNGRGEKVEVTANFHVQSGFTGGIPRYESQSSSCKRMLKFGSDKIEDKKNVKYNLSSRRERQHANLANCLYERTDKVMKKVIIAKVH